MKKKWSIAAASAVSAVLIGAAGYGFWCSSLEDNVIWEKVTINGVALEGKTIENAKEEVQSKFKQDYENAAVKVKLDGKEYTVKVFPVLSLDADKEIERAYKLGHGTWYERGLDYWKVQKSEPVSIEILPEPVYPEKMKEEVMSTGIQSVNTLEETMCELTDSSLKIKKGKTGVKADVALLSESVLEVLKKHEYTAEIDCPVIELVPKTIALKPFHDQIYQKMSNAYLDKDKEYDVVPSVEGISFDINEAEKKLKEAQEGAELVIPFIFEEPEITTEEMKAMLFRDVLGSYTTYGGGTAGRVNNMILASQSCNDVILFPDEVFSYNETVGERTAARGYQAATVFADGQAVPGIGGGICQVSTTLYAACLQAGMEIVERYGHSLPVSYVPAGMDATVSWGSLDYKFKNNTEYPVKLKVAYANGAVQVQLLGTIDTNR